MKKLIFILLLSILLLTGCPAPSETEVSTPPATSTPVMTTPPVTTPAPTTPPPTEPAPTFTLEQRLDTLVNKLEQQRQEFHVPGMAIAVVKDDEVILTRGFGVADIETETPATPETIFAIGSTTKAFTSALVGMMVDEGKMDWDDPVTEYLPYFQLDAASDDENAEVTLRDVLSHRTGFTRMGILFASGQVPLEEVLQDATKAEPYAPLRERFHYSNVVFMSAGVAAGEAAGTEWDTLVGEKIFKPLGMDSTTTSVTQAAEDPRFASGYLWDEDLNDYKYKPARNVDNIGPAGAINSNVLDMAEWLRLQLGLGEYEGRRLISEESLRETWTGHIEIAPGVDYGMGWMIWEWEGQTVIEHGGNVDGFSAQVVMLPESGLGFVLLTNASVSSLPALAINIVWETLLGEVDGGTTEDYDDYTGRYVANFGSFKDAFFTVLVKNGRLALNVPGQMVYELKEPDEEGKWYFAITDQIAVSFERDEAGDVTGMKMYQAGLTFELPREGVEVPVEIPLEELQKYLGSYRLEDLGITLEVLIQNNRLAVDIPGEMAYELYPPDEEGLRYFRATPAISVRFNETPEGQVESLSMFQGGQELIALKVESKALPTVDEIMSLRNAEGNMAALEAMGAYRIDGTVYIAQAGVHGTFSLYVDGPDKYRMEEDYGKYGYSRTAVNNGRAWVESSFGPFEELRGLLLEQALQAHPYVTAVDWRDYYDSVRVLRADTLDGKDVYVLELKKGELPPMTVFVDAATGDVLMTQSMVMQEGGIGVPVTTTSEDFREVDGIRSAARSISSNEQSGRAIFEEVSIETDLELEDAFFILTAPED